MRPPTASPRTLIALVLVATVAVGTTAAAGGYSISASNAIDTPEQTVTLDSSQYTVSSVGQVSQGETLTLATSAPSNTSYDVYLYDNDRNIMATQSVDASESGTVTFDTTGYAPGSYLAAVYVNGNFQAIQPVVVAGYDLSVSAPESATTDESPTVTVSVTPTAASGQPESVEVVLANADATKRVDASRTNGQYEATLSLSSLSTGDYRLYAAARGSATGPSGNHVLLALSQPTSFTVQESTSNSGSTGGGGGGGGGGGSGGGAVSDTTTTSTTTTSTTTTSTTTTDATSTTDQTTTDMTETASSTTDAAETTTGATETTTTGATETPSTTSGSSPDTIPFALGALLLIVGLLTRARR